MAKLDTSRCREESYTDRPTSKEAEDFYGKNVILATRIANQASGGQILVSSLLKELTESGGDIRFGERQEVRLKGLDGNHCVYEVVWE